VTDADATGEDLDAQEAPTSPDLAAGLRCPRCHGERFMLTIVEVNDDGTTAKAIASPCDLCRGAGVVDKATYAAWQLREDQPA
jgi:hypothetical protein